MIRLLYFSSNFVLTRFPFVPGFADLNLEKEVNPMATQEVKRKLTAILSADVEGYSRLMGEDKESTFWSKVLHDSFPQPGGYGRNKGRISGADDYGNIAVFPG